MSTIEVVHREAFQSICGDTWPTADLWCLIWSETSTAAPAVGDRFVAALSPDVNELVTDGYERQPLVGLAATWDTNRLKYLADNLDFGNLEPGDSTGAKGYSVYIRSGDGSDDTLNRLLATVIFDTAQTLDGEPLVVAWAADGVLTDPAS